MSIAERLSAPILKDATHNAAKVNNGPSSIYVCSNTGATELSTRGGINKLSYKYRRNTR